ncbi:MAG: FAD-dependent oxidoreductase [Myxococcota bacterium]
MRVAIVGGGVAGLVCAHRLCEAHDVELFEASEWLGGHAHTVDVEVDGVAVAVDTGFIVYNERNYPRFTALLRELGVETRPTGMSFGFRSDRTGIEYAGGSWSGLLASPRHLLRPRYLAMLRDAARFYRTAARALEDDALEGVSLGDWLERERYGAAFCEDHLLAMGGAIWSVRAEHVRAFPARAFLEFFANHGLLTLSDRPRWRVVRGGSRRYVDALAKGFRERVRLGAPVASIRRDAEGVEVATEAGGAYRFDAVVLACHSDQALALLADATARERDVLGAIAYQANDVVLHTDESHLPRARRARAAWNYRVPVADGERVTVTYDMSLLQGLDTPRPLLVTLNASEPVREDAVLGRFEYAHPVFDARAVAARARHGELQGERHTYYAGAYWGHGFHEDGVASAHRAVAALEAHARRRSRAGRGA